MQNPTLLFIIRLHRLYTALHLIYRQVDLSTFTTDDSPIYMSPNDRGYLLYPLSALSLMNETSLH